MINTNKKQFILRGLDCSSCAGKIEKEVANLVNVNSSNINFATGVLTIIYKEKAINRVQEIKKIVRKHEPHVKVEEKEKAAHQGQDNCPPLPICLPEKLLQFPQKIPKELK